MKCLFFCMLLLLTGCVDQSKVVYVWDLSDVWSFYIVGGLVALWLLCNLWSVIAWKIDQWLKGRRKK